MQDTESTREEDGQGETSEGNPITPTPSPGTSGLQNCEEQVLPCKPSLLSGSFLKYYSPLFGMNSVNWPDLLNTFSYFHVHDRICPGLSPDSAPLAWVSARSSSGHSSPLPFLPSFFPCTSFFFQILMLQLLPEKAYRWRTETAPAYSFVYLIFIFEPIRGLV